MKKFKKALSLLTALIMAVSVINVSGIETFADQNSAELVQVFGQSPQSPQAGDGDGDGTSKSLPKEVTVRVKYRFNKIGSGDFVTNSGARDGGLTFYGNDNRFQQVVSVGNHVSLTAGEETAVYVKVVSGNDTNTKYYKVRITRERASTDANITRIFAKDPSFGVQVGTSEAPKEGAVTAAHNKDRIIETSVTASAGTTVRFYNAKENFAQGGATELPLNPAGQDTDVYIKVTAEDGTTHKYYKVTVTREKNTEADITRINDAAPVQDTGTGNGNESTPIKYKLEVANGVSTLAKNKIVPSADATMEVKTTSFGGSVVAEDNLNIQVGDTTYYIIVTAQDGQTKKYYELKITRKSAPAPSEKEFSQVVGTAVQTLKGTVAERTVVVTGLEAREGSGNTKVADGVTFEITEGNNEGLFKVVGDKILVNDTKELTPKTYNLKVTASKAGYAAKQSDVIAVVVSKKTTQTITIVLPKDLKGKVQTFDKTEGNFGFELVGNNDNSITHVQITKSQAILTLRKAIEEGKEIKVSFEPKKAPQDKKLKFENIELKKSTPTTVRVGESTRWVMNQLNAQAGKKTNQIILQTDKNLVNKEISINHGEIVGFKVTPKAPGREFFPLTHVSVVDKMITLTLQEELDSGTEVVVTYDPNTQNLQAGNKLYYRGEELKAADIPTAEGVVSDQGTIDPPTPKKDNSSESTSRGFSGGRSSVRPNSPDRKSNDKKDIKMVDELPEIKPDSKVSTKLTIGEMKYMIVVDGQGVERTMDVAPMVHMGRTVLPARMISEILGVEVKYDPATRTANFMYGEEKVQLTLGQKFMMVNGKPMPLTADILNVRGRILLPLTDIQKAFAELGLKATVEWDADTKSVTVNK